jgi:hypothetical protein
MGRVILPAGITTGLFAIVFGTLFPFGGRLEASAVVVFGAYFIAALVAAFLAIKRGDVTRHRRWMIRAYAVGLAVGTMRIWLGALQGLSPRPFASGTSYGLLSFEVSFGVAFWLGFVLHALVAEAYLAKRPNPHGATKPALAPHPVVSPRSLGTAR